MFFSIIFFTSFMVILIHCPDQKGLIYQVTHILFSLNLNVIRNDEFVDLSSEYFFMRTEFQGSCNVMLLKERIKKVLPAQSKIDIFKDEPKKLILFATKEYHCLADVLLKCQYKELNAEVMAVISNHHSLEKLVAQFGLPFHFIDHTGIDRLSHEKKVLAALEGYQPDLLVLAKYMRIFSASFVSHFPGRIINIHHSFLPAFKGANPYRQAFHKGVKMIGATAHYVNEELDEGPIIVQNMIRVTHRFTPRQMALAGKDVEKLVLGNALKMVCENRVFIHGNKTVVF